MNTTSSGDLHRDLCAGADDEDEVDHDVRLDGERPAAAAGVRRVEMPAAVTPELTARQRHDIDNWLRKLHRQFGHSAPIEDWKKCCDEEVHIQRHFPW